MTVRVDPSRMANAIRALAMDAVEKAKSGHPGLPMGAADVATVLFTQFLKFDANDPAWPDRDRFVLSAGHGSMLLYALLHLTGYPGMTLDEIKNFRQLGAKTAGHPEYGHAEGIETTEQLEAVRLLGCRYVQGYLLARPVPEREALALLRGGFSVCVD